MNESINQLAKFLRIQGGTVEQKISAIFISQSVYTEQHFWLLYKLKKKN